MEKKPLELEVGICDPSDLRARYCVEMYFLELNERFDDGFDPVLSIPALDAEMTPPEGLFVVADLGRAPVGCAGLKFHGDEPAEMKRLWVAPNIRGRGLGLRLVQTIEELAAEHGMKKLRLDTSHTLVEAIGMYRACGYREVPAFNEEPYADHWFEKDL
jgi:GNAT superfamily N-acetyltransferase